MAHGATLSRRRFSRLVLPLANREQRPRSPASGSRPVPDACGESSGHGRKLTRRRLRCQDSRPYFSPLWPKILRGPFAGTGHVNHSSNICHSRIDRCWGKGHPGCSVPGVRRLKGGGRPRLPVSLADGETAHESKGFVLVCGHGETGEAGFLPCLPACGDALRGSVKPRLLDEFVGDGLDGFLLSTGQEELLNFSAASG